MSASLRPTGRRIVVYVFVALLLASSASTPAAWLAGTACVALGLSLRIWATGYLHKNHRLTTQGPYAYVRHPLYAGTLSCLIGMVVAASGGSGRMRWAVLAIGAAAIAIYFLYYLPYKSRVEADRLVRRFGAAAERYLRHAPNLLPLRRPYRGEPARWSLSRVLANNEHWTCVAAAAALALVWLKTALT
jgi:protein-S-isoprenylcysteine O-methyltransferase Ste14